MGRREGGRTLEAPQEPDEDLRGASEEVGLLFAHSQRMHRSRLPSWWRICWKQLVTRACCLQIWPTSGLSTNFSDFDRQFGSCAVARSSASRSWRLSPRDSTFHALQQSCVMRMISASKARSFHSSGEDTSGDSYA